MGYILPVTNYQYIQYAEREFRIKYDPYRFVPVNKMTAPSNSKEYKHPLPLDIRKNMDKTITFQRLEHTEHIRKKADKAYGKLTGKGLYFSECV